MIFRTLIIGISLALLPQMAYAQCPEGERTRALLEKEPIGEYAKQVIERVDKGIASAKTMPGGSSLFDIFQMHWAINIESIMYMLIDTDVHSVEYSRDLSKISACLHADLAIFEAKMEEVRCELKQAQLNKSPQGVGRLESVALFLNSRYKHLVKGALDTKHVDTIWQYKHGFDEPFGGWCCVVGPTECQPMSSTECSSTERNVTGGNEFYPTRDACLNNGICKTASGPDNDPEYDAICPFDSNYLAPTFSGYGCDLSVLSQFEDLDGTSHQEEYEALDALVTVRDEFLEDTDHIRDSALKMDEILKETMLTDEERQHLDRFGEAKVRDIEHKHVFGCEADVPAEPEDEDTDGDSDPADKVKPSMLWATQEKRGPFFFMEDHLNIWKEFFRLNLKWAEQREFPDYLKRPSEFYEESDREEAMEITTLLVPRDYLRERWSLFMMWQATQEAVILPKAQDMQKGIAEVMKPLRTAMKNNIELVQDSSGGLRKFAKGYAYFLRRSCINRQCNGRLETILKVLFTDECFPYASGEFNPSDEEGGESRTWKDCKEAVESL